MTTRGLVAEEQDEKCVPPTRGVRAGGGVAAKLLVLLSLVCHRHRPSGCVFVSKID